MIRECENPWALDKCQDKIAVLNARTILLRQQTWPGHSEPASNVEERRRNDVYRALSCFS